MSNLNEFITFNSESAYESAYDLAVKKNYSTPKIYFANGDLKKRWYVYFSYKDPTTGKMKRVTPFYGDAQKHKTKEDRLFVLSAYRKKILELLKKGYSPFEDNTELHQNQQEVTATKIALTIETVPAQTPQPITTIPVLTVAPVTTNQKTIKEAFEFALSLKINIVKSRTYKEYESKQKALQVFIKKQYPHITHIDQLTKNMVLQFLNSVLQRTSARSRNNYRLDLSSLMQTSEDNEIIASNMVRKIPILSATPERHKTYSNETQKEIFSYLETKDPVLLLYIKFIYYNFLRPIEVNRLKVGDINLKEKTLQFKAKNSPLKTKIIPDILIDDLPDLSNLDKNNPLFARNTLGGVWETTVENKRNYFTKRYHKVVKTHFKLGADYGLYSFRHTAITKLYRELRKSATPYEAKSNLKLITGHSSMAALEKYLRDIDAELPVDYSELIRTT